MTAQREKSEILKDQELGGRWGYSLMEGSGSGDKYTQFFFQGGVLGTEAQCLYIHVYPCMLNFQCERNMKLNLILTVIKPSSTYLPCYLSSLECVMETGYF